MNNINEANMHVRCHCKCRKCGEEADIDSAIVCASIPPQYQYKCPHCGDVGYVLCDEAYYVPTQEDDEVFDRKGLDIYEADVIGDGLFSSLAVCPAVDDHANAYSISLGAGDACYWQGEKLEIDPAAIALINDKPLLTDILECAMDRLIDEIKPIGQFLEDDGPLRKFNEVYRVYKSLNPQSENVWYYKAYHSDFNKKTEDR